MRRDELEHLVRSAGAILGESVVFVVGSQSILASIPHGLPPEATVSVEADILPPNDPDGSKADLIDGTIGEESPFHRTFGVYAQGVGRWTSRLPDGWESRLVPIAVDGVTARCLEPHDLLIAKYLANRPKDREFCRAIARNGYVDAALLRERLDAVAASPEERARILAAIEADFESA